MKRCQQESRCWQERQGVDTYSRCLWQLVAAVSLVQAAYLRTKFTGSGMQKCRFVRKSQMHTAILLALPAKAAQGCCLLSGICRSDSYHDLIL